MQQAAVAKAAAEAVMGVVEPRVPPAEAAGAAAAAGGRGICQHGRQKYLCSHGRRQSLCKECSGNRICTHRHKTKRSKESEQMHLLHTAQKSTS